MNNLLFKRRCIRGNSLGVSGLILGTKIQSFFHIMVTSRRRRNRILMPKNDDGE